MAIVAPASPFQRRRFLRAASWLASNGFDVTYRPGIFARSGYLAGSDARRAGEFRRFFADPEVDAIFAARGGYGSLRLLEALSVTGEPFPKGGRPKIVSGMSDLTVLLNQISLRTGVVTTHGPVLAGDLFEGMGERAKKGWLSQFVRPSPRLLRAPADFRIVRAGNGRVRLWGGNLSMVAATIGTRFEVPSEGILFLEEVAEPRYRIDRMFAQLALAGFFARIRGLLLGDFTEPSGKPHRAAWVAEIVGRYVSRKIPVLGGVKAGHTHAEVLLPIGGEARIESSGKRLLLSPLARGPRS